MVIINNGLINKIDLFSWNKIKKINAYGIVLIKVK